LEDGQVAAVEYHHAQIGIDEVQGLSVDGDPRRETGFGLGKKRGAAASVALHRHDDV
jgi:hypothetical protein